MDDIKYEEELRLENILVSVNKDNLNRLNELVDLKEIDVMDKELLKKFIYMTNQVEDRLSIETLKKEFPSLYFDRVTYLNVDKELDDYIRLYIATIKNNYIAKKLMLLAQKVRNSGISEDVSNDLISLTKSDVVSIEHQDISKNIIDEYNKKVNTSGIKTNVARIDTDTGGLQPGTLSVILGFTGSFKTTFAVNIAYNAITEGKNVLYLSLEVTKENIYYDLLSRHSSNSNFGTHIEHLSFKQRKLTKKEYNFFENTLVKDFNSIPNKIYIVDETELESYSFYSFETKFREIEKLAIEETGHGIDLFVIDHAQLLKFDTSMKGIGNETNIVNTYVSFFRQCVLNWIKSGRQVAGLILSQASREGWKEAVRHDGKYRLTALADANELERAATLVLSIYSSDSLKQINAAKVQILKNRDGQAWEEPMEVFVDPKYYLFGNGNQSTSDTSFKMEDMSSLFNMDNESLNNIVTLQEENINLNTLDLGI